MISNQVQKGDFVKFGKSFGKVQDVQVISESIRRLLIQEHPDQPVDNWYYYRLNVNQFEIQ